MAYAKRRKNGKYTAIYLLPSGRERSAGTFDDKETAEKVAASTEAHVRKGASGPSPADRATITIREYGPEWLRNHRVEPNTKVSYAAILNRHIYPRFGTVRVAELEREAVRAYFTEMQEAGLTPQYQRHVRAVLSAMMRVAVEDGYRSDNPVRGLGVQRDGKKAITVLTTEQFQRVYANLPSDGARLLARFIVSTGCRYGEAVVLHPADIDFESGSVWFHKALQDVGRAYHPDGKSRFYVAPFTKTKSDRRVRLDAATLAALRAWIAEHNIADDELIFPRLLIIPHTEREYPRIELTEAFIATLGTKVGPNGKEYRHGTWQCYVTAKCRGCQYCRQAFADYKRGLRNRERSTTMAQPVVGRGYDESAFLPSHRWSAAWKAACTAAELPFMPTAYQLRHTHASWLIEKGEDPKTVMVRLGHTTLRTTELYVHQVDDGASAADIMGSLGIDWDAA